MRAIHSNHRAAPCVNPSGIVIIMQGSDGVFQRIDQLLSYATLGLRSGSVSLLYFLRWSLNYDQPGRPGVRHDLSTTVPCQRRAHQCLSQRKCERFFILLRNSMEYLDRSQLYLDSNLMEDNAPLNRDIHKRQPTWLVTCFGLLDACSNMVYWSTNLLPHRTELHTPDIL